MEDYFGMIMSVDTIFAWSLESFCDTKIGWP